MEITIISSIVLALGIFLLYVANSWYFGSAIEATEEVDKNVHMVRSALMIEEITYHYAENKSNVSDKANVTVRNVAKDNINLRIIAVELLSADGRLCGHLSLTTEPDSNYTLKPGEKKVLVGVPTCDECHRGDILVYRVWYVSERYADDPFLMLDNALFAEASFLYSGGEPFLACPLPSDDNYVFIDLVDPIIDTGGKFTGSNKVKVRPAYKKSPSIINLGVNVENLNEGTWGSGSLDGVQVPSFTEVDISGNFSDIKVPFKISISSPDTMIIQSEWIFGGIPDRVAVNDVQVLWKETDRTAYMVIVTISTPATLSEDITIKVSVRIKDCSGNELDYLEARESIVRSGRGNVDYYQPIFIRLHKAIRLDQIYFLEIQIAEVG